ncbi:MAG: xanthine dehydrogenase family protein molybdopterin-binding subunit [Acidobacteria bacterium]|nr:MAG: xanthine dehydrogenase family protein molybdopterin-binding subunit [Acidobacteriota bacterium]
MSKHSEVVPNSTLIDDAAAALGRAGFSRRSFLVGAGALVVSFSMKGALQTALAQGPFEGGTAGSPPLNQLDSWIAIAADGGVTAYTGKAELGQGISTAQIQLVAEELCVPFSRVKLMYCDTVQTPDQGITSGSQSHPTNFNQKNLAQAAATAREALLKLASKRLGFSADQLVAKDGVISAKIDPSKKVGYGDLVGAKKFEIKLDPNVKRKSASEWTVLGTPARRPDMPALVTGQFEFVHNVRLPGMLHGRVLRPPAVGATVVNVDESSVQALPGVVKVVVKKNFVGVVAEKPWQAIQAVNKLKVTWSAGTGLPSHADFYNYLRSQQPTRDTLLVNSTDVDEKLAQAATVVKATYYYPNQMHGSLGTSCAVADVQGDKATIYSPTQGVWPVRNSTSILLGLKPENVHVIFRRGSGCYGLNGADTVTYDAALLSQAVGKPVRVQLSRKDEMAWGENYGFAFVVDERAGLDAQGNIVAWDHESWSANLGNRPGYTTPGNVITGTLAGFSPEPFMARSPAPEPRVYTNNSNGVPSYVAGNVGGKPQGTGTVKSERSLTHNIPSPLFTAPLRSPARLQNTFAHESFMDELAARAKADPVAFRLRHLSDERLIEVVKEAAALANWEARPSPKPQNRRTGIATGRGFSCVAYEGENGWAAMVAQVEVNQDTGKVTVKRIFFSNDSGPISNPDGLRNQIEGGALQGMSRAMSEEVTWDDQRVTSVDWESYRSLPLGFDVPEIKVKLINRPDENATGAGETSITIVAAAIGNAIFDATGARIRQVPFTPQRVKAALSQTFSQA